MSRAHALAQMSDAEQAAPPALPSAATLREIETLLARLAALDEAALGAHIDAEHAAYRGLLRAIGLFLSTACGAPGRLGERVTQLELRHAEGLDARHNSAAYGADIVVGAPGAAAVRVECKDSHVKRAKGYKSNWMFELAPSVRIARDNAAAMIAATSAKMDLVVLKAHAPDAAASREYRLSGAFVALFVAQSLLRWVDVPAHVARCVNLGSRACRHCGAYHRIEKLQRLDALLAERLAGAPLEHRLDYLSAAEWADANRAVAADCAPK